MPGSTVPAPRTSVARRARPMGARRPGWSPNLLTGLARCERCGGGLYVRSRSHGDHRAFFYGCATYHNRGTSVCTNHLEVPMVATDRAVLASIELYVLHPEVIEAAISEAMRLLNPTPMDLKSVGAGSVM